MKAACLLLASLLVLAAAPSTRADTFGTGANAFTIDFVTVGNPGNLDDSGTTGAFSSPLGGVSYTFRIGTYEISRATILKANAPVASGGGNLGITHLNYDALGIGVGKGDVRPASEISWNEAARFVNWLNLSNGFSAAYKFALQPGDAGYNSNTNILLWEPGEPGYNPANRYRNTNAFYFLPSEDEWYKAAYYSGAGAIYFDYATQQNYPSAPTAIAQGTGSGTSVYFQSYSTGPAATNNAGGLSHYGTMAQNGNVNEWQEDSYDALNDNPSKSRRFSGIAWSDQVEGRSSIRSFVNPDNSATNTGFRVASIPEPSSALLLAAAGGTLLLRRRRGER